MEGETGGGGINAEAVTDGFVGGRVREAEECRGEGVIGWERREGGERRGDESEEEGERWF